MKTVFFLFLLLCTRHCAPAVNRSPGPGREAQETAQPPVYDPGYDAPAASAEKAARRIRN
jgi:hypothetical protein